ncbi:MAG TPA: hypothetical protein VE011_06250 [Candidatus Dormibacteraeota bacterium]|nr:hypothetical protein [Candidatus Dormibacteraeota bacterium]
MATDRVAQVALGARPMGDGGAGAPRTFVGLPAHVLVLLAASTAGYALMLAAVTGLQSRSEAALAAARQPAVDGIVQVRAGHDDLTTKLDAAQADYNSTVAAYVAAGGSLDLLTSKLAVLTSLVGEIDGVSRSMPAAITLPTVHTSVGTVRSPITQSTTGASGAVK